MNILQLGLIIVASWSLCQASLTNEKELEFEKLYVHHRYFDEWNSSETETVSTMSSTHSTSSTFTSSSTPTEDSNTTVLVETSTSGRSTSDIGAVTTQPYQESVSTEEVNFKTDVITISNSSSLATTPQKENMNTKILSQTPTPDAVSTFELEKETSDVFQNKESTHKTFSTTDPSSSFSSQIENELIKNDKNQYTLTPTAASSISGEPKIHNKDIPTASSTLSHSTPTSSIPKLINVEKQTTVTLSHQRRPHVIRRAKVVKFTCFRGTTCQIKFNEANSNIRRTMYSVMISGSPNSEMFLVHKGENTLTGVPMIEGINDFVLLNKNIELKFQVEVKPQNKSNHLFVVILERPTEFQILEFPNTKNVLLEFLSKSLSASIETISLTNVYTTENNKTIIEFYNNSLSSDYCEREKIDSSLITFMFPEFVKKMSPDFVVNSAAMKFLNVCEGKMLPTPLPLTQKDPDVLTRIVAVFLVFIGLLSMVLINCFCFPQKEVLRRLSPSIEDPFEDRRYHGHPH